jgi:hypothetical protein
MAMVEQQAAARKGAAGGKGKAKAGRGTGQGKKQAAAKAIEAGDE